MPTAAHFAVVTAVSLKKKKTASVRQDHTLKLEGTSPSAQNSCRAGAGMNCMCWRLMQVGIFGLVEARWPQVDAFCAWCERQAGGLAWPGRVGWDGLGIIGSTNRNH